MTAIYPEPRTIRQGGWCCLCHAVDVPTTTGGRGGMVCRKCTSDAADVALFEEFNNAQTVAVVEDPEKPGKPWLEWMRSDKPGPNEGVLGIHDGKKFDVYRVDAADALAGRGFKFTKLTSKDKHSYTCVVSSGGAVQVGCECWSWLSRMKCRHTKAASALLARKMV